MPRQIVSSRLSLAVALLIACGQAPARDIQVAVASNFSAPIAALARHFEETSGRQLTVILGSTGKHYAQVRNGAPFDALLAADRERPEMLEQQGFAAPGSRFTYAIGRIVLWSPVAGLVDPAGQVLERPQVRHLAIANPKLAPYGKAAMQVLQARGLWDTWQARVIKGENIMQTFQFVSSGNAEMGFVAYSQVRRPGHPVEGSFWEAPLSDYDAIEQQAVLLKDSDAARAFLLYLQSPGAREIIRSHGYATP